MSGAGTDLEPFGRPRRVLVIAPPGYRSEALMTLLKAVRPPLVCWSSPTPEPDGVAGGAPDLIVCMPGWGANRLFEQALEVKREHPATPLFVCSEKASQQSELRRMGVDEVLPPVFSCGHLSQLLEQWLFNPHQ